MTNARRYPRVAQAVYLTLEDRNGAFHEARTVVEDITRDGSIVLAVPVEHEGFRAVRPGMALMLEYNTEKALYRTTTLVRARQVRNGIDLMVVDPPEELERVQRRWHVRLPVSLLVRFGIFDSISGNGNRKEEKFTANWTSNGHLVYTARTEDVSGGGMLMVTAAPVAEGQEIFLELRLPEQTMRLAGQVVRVTPVDGEEDQGNRLMAVEFVGIQERERDAIVRFIFSEQRRRRQLGLG